PSAAQSRAKPVGRRPRTRRRAGHQAVGGAPRIVRRHGTTLRILLIAAVVSSGVAAAGAAASPQRPEHGATRQGARASVSAAKVHTKFLARGSAKQVDVTGVAPRARTTLLNKAGHRVATKKADSLGGVLFRLVET